MGAPGQWLEHGCRTGARAPAHIWATIAVAGQAGCRERQTPELRRRRRASLATSALTSQVQDLQKAGMIMRILDPAVLPVLSPELSGGGHRDDLQCEVDSNCDLAAANRHGAASDVNDSDTYMTATIRGLACEG